jgi:hypothetical protein
MTYRWWRVCSALACLLRAFLCVACVRVRGRCSRYADGSSYEGFFKGGRRHGRGSQTNPDGSAWHDGLWLDGDPVALVAESLAESTADNSAHDDDANGNGDSGDDDGAGGGGGPMLRMSVQRSSAPGVAAGVAAPVLASLPGVERSSAPDVSAAEEPQSTVDLEGVWGFLAAFVATAGHARALEHFASADKVTDKHTGQGRLGQAPTKAKMRTLQEHLLVSLGMRWPCMMLLPPPPSPLF